MGEIETEFILKRKEFFMSFDNLNKRLIQAVKKTAPFELF